MNYEQKYLKYKNKYLALKNNNRFNAKEMNIGVPQKYDIIFNENVLTIRYTQLNNKKIIINITGDKKGTLYIYDNNRQLVSTINYDETNYEANKSIINNYINLEEFKESMKSANDKLFDSKFSFIRQTISPEAHKKMISHVGFLLGYL